jgi:hypothetical protein
MVNNQLLDYIKQQLDQGLSRETIQQNLISDGGWSLSDITEAFSAPGINQNSNIPNSSSMVTFLPVNYKLTFYLVILYTIIFILWTVINYATIYLPYSQSFREASNRGSFVTNKEASLQYPVTIIDPQKGVEVDAKEEQLLAEEYRGKGYVWADHTGEYKVNSIWDKGNELILYYDGKTYPQYELSESFTTQYVGGDKPVNKFEMNGISWSVFQSSSGFVTAFGTKGKLSILLTQFFTPTNLEAVSNIIDNIR